MVLPFHNATVHSVDDTSTYSSYLAAAADKPGIYLVGMKAEKTYPTEQPYVFLSSSRTRGSELGRQLALGLLVQMIGAFFWTWILGKIPGLTLKDSALYGLFFGLCVGVLGAMPNWVWWKFPLPFTLLYVADAAVAWTLASLALSRCYAAACALPSKPA